jgi:ubiquinone/menaquinone biosynthesis C-methylase UbiE
LQIPADDYEAHMNAVGQSAVLRELFAAAYAERRPARLAILGCTTGRDFSHVDPATTELVVGVDVNGDYLERARQRGSALGSRLRLIEGDVLLVDLPAGSFDLVHAALLFEYVEPLALFRRIHRWLSPEGLCSVVTQEPTPDVPAVSRTPYASLQTLHGRMRLRPADELAAVAGHAHLRLRRARAVKLPSGKTLVHSTFDRGASP